MISTEQLSLAYDQDLIIKNVTCKVPEQAVTVIVGPNGCGKSTLLKGIARQLPIRSGGVTLGSKAIGDYQPKELARTLAFLPQKNRSPDGVTVRQLVALGRYPYQSLFQRETQEDIDATNAAIELCQVSKLADRPVTQLSGGQQQKAWLAMIVAQDANVMLLDEPTSALDLGHQMDVANLIRSFADSGKTIVAVLHDLYLASLVADHLIVLKDGELLTSGKPTSVITTDLITTLYRIPSAIIKDPDNGVPIVLRRLSADAGPRLSGNSLKPRPPWLPQKQ